MRNRPTRRGACLLGLAMLIPPAGVAAAASGTPRAAPPTRPPRNRAPARDVRKQAAIRRAALPAPPPQRPPRQGAGNQAPRSRAPAGETPSPAANRRAETPPAPARPRWPQIDDPPPPSRRPGWDAAPVPDANVLPPIGERRPGTGVSFGVPTTPQIVEGQTFRPDDAAPQDRQRPQQGGGLRLPSPGATVRLPF